MRGYLCDHCKRFWSGMPGAEIRFLCFVDDEGKPLPEQTTHACPDCVIGLLHSYGPDAQRVTDDDFHPESEDEA